MILADSAGLLGPERLVRAFRWRGAVTITDPIEINPKVMLGKRENIRAALGFKDQVWT